MYDDILGVVGILAPGIVVVAKAQLTDDDNQRWHTQHKTQSAEQLIESLKRGIRGIRKGVVNLSSARTLSGRESGAETVIYRRCRTQTVDAGTPMYAPTISFVAVSVGRIVNPPRPHVGDAKSLTYVAPNRGVHDKGVCRQRKAAHEKPGTQEESVYVHAVDLPWYADEREDAPEKRGGGKEREFGRRRHEEYKKELL